MIIPSVHALKRNIRIGLAGLCALAAAPAWGNIQSVKLDQKYLTSGEKGQGEVLLDNTGDFPKDAHLRVTLTRTTDIAAGNGKVGSSTQQVIDQPIGDVAGKNKVNFDVAAEGMLIGTIQARAEIAGGNQPALSQADSGLLNVGIRKHLSLYGDWAVTKIDNLDYANQWRPKNWKVPDMKTVVFPGAITSDGFFRGFVTLAKDVEWQQVASNENRTGQELLPRILRTSGVSNSVKVTIDGNVVGEVQPTSDLNDETSKWGEFHSQFKGDENKLKRELMDDDDVVPAMTMPLPKALPASGKAHVEMELRGTSGAFDPKPLYGVFGDLHLELTPAVFIKAVSFDTDKPNEMRRFKFTLTVENDSGKAFSGKIHAVYGCYQGEIPYTGACPAYDAADQAVSLNAGENKVEVDRDEQPRFATCRATFLVENSSNTILDGESQDIQTVTVEIRNRRELYLNNERFIVKAQGSAGDDANARLNFRISGANAFRGHHAIQSIQFPMLVSSADEINDRYKDGLLTSAGSALLASCERCIFYNPQDTSNIENAAHNITRTLAPCPGIFEWEVTNELYGEPTEARVAVQTFFHKYDPYHRPVMATKGGGEWEAVSHDGKVDGVDIVGCQYLLSEEEVNSITAAVTEQPLMCTEVNYNDSMLMDHNMWHTWLSKGLTGCLLFDYSGSAMQQPIPLVPPKSTENIPYNVLRDTNRALFQDFTASAIKMADGHVRVTFGDQMPYTLHKIDLYVRDFGKFSIPDLNPGDAASIDLPADHSPNVSEPVVTRLDYVTHSGLKHLAVLTPLVVAAPASASAK